MSALAAGRVRLDLHLVAVGLARSREEARRRILAGEVRIGDRIANRASEAVAIDAPVRIESRRAAYVSRGGQKLEGALDALGLDVAGFVAMDVGASTGGFTDCLLRRGAARVYAVDVGYGQLDWGLRQDPRVIVLERQNIRHLESQAIPEPVDVATIDVSFISLRLVLPEVLPRVRPGGTIVALVKPQFEVGKGKVGKGGVVRDEALQTAAVESIRDAARGLGLRELGIAESVLQGPKGNREFFVGWNRPD